MQLSDGPNKRTYDYCLGLTLVIWLIVTLKASSSGLSDKTSVPEHSFKTRICFGWDMKLSNPRALAPLLRRVSFCT